MVLKHKLKPLYCDVCGILCKSGRISLSQHIRIHKLLPKEYYLKYPLNEKWCRLCKDWLNISLFSKNDNSTDGYGNLCNKCNVKWVKKYYNKDKKSSYDKEYRDRPEVRERKRNLSRSYRVRTRDKRNRWEKERYAKFPEMYRARGRRYSKTEKGRKMRKAQVARFQKTEKGKQCLWRQNAKRRAREKQVEEYLPINFKNIIRELFDNKCFKCKKIIDLSIDHYYPLSNGNGFLINKKLNSVLLCRNCNSMKYNLSPLIFFSEEEIKQYQEKVKEYECITSRSS